MFSSPFKSAAVCRSRPRSAELHSAVSPNCIRQNVGQHRSASNLSRRADCKSAIQQNAILRYKAPSPLRSAGALQRLGLVCAVFVLSVMALSAAVAPAESRSNLVHALLSEDLSEQTQFI